MYLTQIVSVVNNAISIASPKIHASLDAVVAEIVEDEMRNIEHDCDFADSAEEKHIYRSMYDELPNIGTQIGKFFAQNDNEDKTMVMPSVWAGSAINDEGRDWVIMPLKAA